MHYDHIGVLKPAFRGENNYRYYSPEQMSDVNLIRTCLSLDIPLHAIVSLHKSRTPESVAEILERQGMLIESKIEELARARKLLHTLKKTISSASLVVEDTIITKYLQPEAIVLGELTDYSQGRTNYSALASFYSDCAERYPDMDLNYPVSCMFTEYQIKQRDWLWPERYYMHNPEGYDKRPGSLYAIGYTRGGYGSGTILFERLIEYIDANGLEVCGPAYEEYPLNEISICERNNYLIRIMITVREEKKIGKR